MSVSLGIMVFQVRDVHPVVNVKEYRSLFTAATPLGLALIFNLVYFHADSVILALTRPTWEVGVYGLAYKVFELPLVVPIFFMNAVYPLLLRTKNHEPRTNQRVFYTSFWFLVFSSLLIGVVLWFAAPLVSYIRPEFIQSTAPLRVLVLGIPIFFVSGLLMWFLIAEHLGRTLLKIHGVVMMGNIVANMLLVPVYGYQASAWITVVSEFFVLVVTGAVVWRRGV